MGKSLTLTQRLEKYFINKETISNDTSVVGGQSKRDGRGGKL